MTVLRIDRRWGGAVADAADRAVLAADREGEALVVRWIAPVGDGTVPDAAPGPHDGLWDHEVVEVFLAGSGRDYLELEFGPGGHHLALGLTDVRRPAWRGRPLPLGVAVEGGVWAGVARVPAAWLPRGGVTRAAAFRITGPTGARRHLASQVLPGASPDFHQPAAFAPYALGTRSSARAWAALDAAWGRRRPAPTDPRG